MTVLVAACSGTGGPGASTPSNAPTSVIAPASPSPRAVTPSATQSKAAGPGDVVFSGNVAVGAGRTLEVRCVGVGTPTILLEGGGIDPSLSEYPSAWVNKLGMHTTTCHYSRAGGGSSSQLVGSRTMAATVADAYHLLDALKTEANISGPYVFAGWSFGGTVALAEALEHPDRTAGLVILDTDFLSDFIKVCRSTGRTGADCQAEYDGDIEAKSMEAELVPKVHPLPGIPIAIVSAMQLDDCDAAAGGPVHAGIAGVTLTANDCPGLAKLIAAKQLREWSHLGAQVTQTLVDAGHNGLIDQAGTQVEQVILGALAEARTKTK